MASETVTHTATDVRCSNCNGVGSLQGQVQGSRMEICSVCGGTGVDPLVSYGVHDKISHPRPTVDWLHQTLVDELKASQFGPFVQDRGISTSTNTSDELLSGRVRQVGDRLEFTVRFECVCRDYELSMAVDMSLLSPLFKPEEIIDKVRDSYAEAWEEHGGNVIVASRIHAAGKMMQDGDLRGSWEQLRDAMVEVSAICVAHGAVEESETSPVERGAVERNMVAVVRWVTEEKVRAQLKRRSGNTLRSSYTAGIYAGARAVTKPDEAEVRRFLDKDVQEMEFVTGYEGINRGVDDRTRFGPSPSGVEVRDIQDSVRDSLTSVRDVREQAQDLSDRLDAGAPRMTPEMMETMESIHELHRDSEDWHVGGSLARATTRADVEQMARNLGIEIGGAYTSDMALGIAELNERLPMGFTVGTVNTTDGGKRVLLLGLLRGDGSTEDPNDS